MGGIWHYTDPTWHRVLTPAGLAIDQNWVNNFNRGTAGGTYTEYCLPSSVGKYGLNGPCANVINTTGLALPSYPEHVVFQFATNLLCPIYSKLICQQEDTCNVSKSNECGSGD
jgi:hypothetical protein